MEMNVTSKTLLDRYFNQRKLTKDDMTTCLTCSTAFLLFCCKMTLEKYVVYKPIKIR